jgi:hypothetical protein
MERRQVALGRAAVVDVGVGTVAAPKTAEERLAIIEAKVDMLAEIVSLLQEKGDIREDAPVDPNSNGDGIPYYTNLIGVTKGQPYVLTVREDSYYLGNKPYRTLSAAAKAVCGHRKSGWVFWKLVDGRTVKEAFGKK